MRITPSRAPVSCPGDRYLPSGRGGAPPTDSPWCVHGAPDERGMSSEDEATSGPLRGMASDERGALTTLEASAWASGGLTAVGRGLAPAPLPRPLLTTTLHVRPSCKPCTTTDAPLVGADLDAG